MNATPWARPANRSEAYMNDTTDSYTIIRVDDLVNQGSDGPGSNQFNNWNTWDVLYTDKNGVEMTYSSGLTLIKARELAKTANELRQRHLMNFLR
jgi:hypothetical protein